MKIGLRPCQRGFLRLQVGHFGAQQSNLIVHGLDGVLQLETLASGLCLDAAHLGPSNCQVGLGRGDGGLLDRHLHLVWLLVEFHQQVALAHAVIVIHEHSGHLAGHAGGHERDVAIDISVIG